MILWKKLTLYCPTRIWKSHFHLKNMHSSIKVVHFLVWLNVLLLFLCSVIATRCGVWSLVECRAHCNINGRDVATKNKLDGDPISQIKSDKRPAVHLMVRGDNLPDWSKKVMCAVTKRRTHPLSWSHSCSIKSEW